MRQFAPNPSNDWGFEGDLADEIEEYLRLPPITAEAELIPVEEMTQSVPALRPSKAPRTPLYRDFQTEETFLVKPFNAGLRNSYILHFNIMRHFLL